MCASWHSASQTHCVPGQPMPGYQDASPMQTSSVIRSTKISSKGAREDARSAAPRPQSRSRNRSATGSESSEKHAAWHAATLSLGVSQVPPVPW